MIYFICGSPITRMLPSGARPALATPQQLIVWWDGPWDQIISLGIFQSRWSSSKRCQNGRLGRQTFELICQEHTQDGQKNC